MSDEPSDEDQPVELPIDGTLDLHLFRPRDLGRLLPEYLQLCREKGILDVKVVHGKGTGALRRSVHALLEKMPGVASFRTPAESDGGWGATWVHLHPHDEGR